MITISNKIKPSVNKNDATLSTNNRNLMRNNVALLQEQVKIKNMLDQFNDIDQSYISKSLNADQKNASYYMWLIITTVALILTANFLFFP
jgi:hypothetical protein